MNGWTIAVKRICHGKPAFAAGRAHCIINIDGGGDSEERQGAWIDRLSMYEEMPSLSYYYLCVRARRRT